jgi:hypothetical protein
MRRSIGNQTSRVRLNRKILEQCWSIVTTRKYANPFNPFTRAPSQLAGSEFRDERSGAYRVAKNINGIEACGADQNTKTFPTTSRLAVSESLEAWRVSYVENLHCDAGDGSVCWVPDL